MRTLTFYQLFIGLLLGVVGACSSASSTKSETKLLDQVLSVYIAEHDLSLDSIVLLSSTVAIEGVQFNAPEILDIKKEGFVSVAHDLSISCESFKVIEIEEVSHHIELGFIAIGIVDIYKFEDQRIIEFQVFCKGGSCCNYDLYRMKQRADGEWVLDEIIESNINC